MHTLAMKVHDWFVGATMPTRLSGPVSIRAALCSATYQRNCTSNERSHVVLFPKRRASPSTHTEIGIPNRAIGGCNAFQCPDGMDSEKVGSRGFSQRPSRTRDRMKWLPGRTGRSVLRRHYLQAELDEECERLILSFLRKRHGKVVFPIKTDNLTVLIEERSDLDSCVDLSDEPGDVEGVTESVPGKRPIVRIYDSLSHSHMENRPRTTLTHEYGHVYFHHFMFADRDLQLPSLSPRKQQSPCDKGSIGRR